MAGREPFWNGWHVTLGALILFIVSVSLVGVWGTVISQ